MYGMIHEAARRLATSRLGEAQRRAPLSRSGLKARRFIGARHGSEAKTLHLVGRIAERLGSGVAETPGTLGGHRFEFAKSSGYADPRRCAGMIAK